VRTMLPTMMKTLMIVGFWGKWTIIPTKCDEA
jgi:hypothetical protein